MTALGDRLIEQGPYDETVHPRYGAETRVFGNAEVNELRRELLAARAIVAAYRKSRAKGFFRSPRGPVANAVDDYDRVLGGGPS